jgi:hypothetical protein
MMDISEFIEEIQRSVCKLHQQNIKVQNRDTLLVVFSVKIVARVHSFQVGSDNELYTTTGLCQ